MPTLHIKYFLTQADPARPATLLGREEYHGITQCLVPDEREESHVVTMTKAFDGVNNLRWRVDKVEHPSAVDASIFLSDWEPTVPEVFLAEAYKLQRGILSSLTFGTLVEVDFGYISFIKKSDGAVRSSKRYPDSLQTGEMHKRRLCVVVRATRRGVQVVPITSKTPDGDASCAHEISHESLKNLTNYCSGDIRSFAIPSMITTVSFNRVLPPLSRTDKRRQEMRDGRYNNRLKGDDKKGFHLALSHSLQMQDYFPLKERDLDQRATIKGLKAELAGRDAQIAQLIEESNRVPALQQQIESLQGLAAYYLEEQGVPEDEAKARVAEDTETWREMHASEDISHTKEDAGV